MENSKFVYIDYEDYWRLWSINFLYIYIYALLIKNKLSLPQSTLHCHNENLKIVWNSSSFSNLYLTMGLWGQC